MPAVATVVAPPQVFLVSDGFEMVWANAERNATEVVDLVALRQGPARSDVAETVRVELGFADVDYAVSNTVGPSSPGPAVAANRDRRPEIRAQQLRKGDLVYAVILPCLR